jgi:hypothetical protein
LGEIAESQRLSFIKPFGFVFVLGSQKTIEAFSASAMANEADAFENASAWGGRGMVMAASNCSPVTTFQTWILSDVDTARVLPSCDKANREKEFVTIPKLLRSFPEVVSYTEIAAAAESVSESFGRAIVTSLSSGAHAR